MEFDLIFEKYIMPKLMLSSFGDVTPELLHSLGRRLVICDIDNTLVTYDDPRPTDELLAWFDEMNSAGITVAFASNNHAERVEEFNRELGFEARADAGKPKTRALLEVMHELGVTSDETALLGDQLLTDACAANRAGIYSIIVPPIKDKTSLFFKAKRLIERPYVAKYKRLCRKLDDRA